MRRAIGDRQFASGNYGVCFPIALVTFTFLVAGTPWAIGTFRFSFLVKLVLVGLTSVAALAVIATMHRPPSAEAIATRAARALGGVLDWWGLIVVAVVAAAIGGLWLQGFPISGDVYAVLLQAETYASGRLVAPAPPVPEAFDYSRFVIVGDVWVSQYPPGWAVLLTPFVLLGVPTWVVPGLFSAGIVWLFWHLALRRLDHAHAALGVLVLCLSPFFILNASTLYPHAATTFFGMAAVAAVLKRLDGGGIIWCILAGGLLGAMGLIRPFNAVIFVVVLCGALVLVPSPRRPFGGRRALSLIAVGLGGVPFAIALLAYHHAITGSAFVTIPAWMGKTEPLGLINFASLKETLRRLTDLVLTTSPVLVAAAGLAPLALAVARRLTVVDLVFPATVAAFAFYGGTGGIEQSYGPRYLFEAFPFLVLSAMAAVARFAPRVPFVAAALATHLLVAPIGIVSWLIFERGAIYHLAEPYRLARDHRLSNAVVLLQKGPGHLVAGFRRGYVGDYNRNGLDVTLPDVVYALDGEDLRDRLQAEFPDRSFHVYDGQVVKPLNMRNGRSGHR